MAEDIQNQSDTSQTNDTQATDDTQTTSLLGGEDVTDTSKDTTTVDWRGMLGDYANDPNIDKFKDPKDLAKSYIEAQKLIGRDKIPMPKDETELQQVLTKLGVPDDPSKYPDFEDVTKVFASPEEFTEFKKVAHEVGLLPQQFEALYGKMKEIMQQDSQVSMEERQAMTQQALQQITQEFGNEAQAKLNTAQKVFKTFSDDVKQQIVQANLDVNPNFIKALANLGEYYKEDNFVASSYSQADAKGELQSIMNNSKHPYFDREHPEHDAAVEKVKTLYKIIYGG